MVVASDFLRFSGILKRWIAEIWMLFIVILGEYYCISSLVEAEYSAVSLGASNNHNRNYLRKS